MGAIANLAGSYAAGTLTLRNATQTAAIGAVAGAAAVLTAGTGSIAGATTLIGILTAELGASFTGALVGAGVDIGLTLLMSPPDQLPAGGGACR